MRQFVFLMTMMVSSFGMNHALAEEAGDAALGATQWANNCARCHNMRDPTEFRAEIWRPIMLHMRIRAGLNGAEARNILAFLQGSAADANQTFRVTPIAMSASAASSEAMSGQSVYQTTCVACHGADGNGVLPGAPDFSAADSPLRSKTQEELLRNMINGFKSAGSPMGMPAKGGNPALTERDMQSVLEYMQESFSN